MVHVPHGSISPAYASVGQVSHAEPPGNFNWLENEKNNPVECSHLPGHYSSVKSICTDKTGKTNQGPSKSTPSYTLHMYGKNPKELKNKMWYEAKRLVAIILFFFAIVSILNMFFNVVIPNTLILGVILLLFGNQLLTESELDKIEELKKEEEKEE